MKPYWVIICLFVVSAWRYDLSVFSNRGSSGSQINQNVIRRHSSCSILCSAEDSVFMGFGGKQAHENRNRPEWDESDDRMPSHGDVTNEDILPALPEPTLRDPSDPVRTVEVNGDAVSMDELGPIIVNADGTLRRIENWATLTKSEQASTIKIISRRNKKRLTALKEQQSEKEARTNEPASSEL